MIALSPHSTDVAIYAICIYNKIAYIGKSKNLWNRVSAHKTGIAHSDKVWYPLARECHKRGHWITLKILDKPQVKELSKKEQQYITQFNPYFNIQLSKNHYLDSSNYDSTVKALGIKWLPPIVEQELPKRFNWFGE